VWGSIASLTTLIHKMQSKVDEMTLMSAVMRNKIKDDVGKYKEQKLMSVGLSHSLKSELT
jgi:hypothetical protein